GPPVADQPAGERGAQERREGHGEHPQPGLQGATADARRASARARLAALNDREREVAVAVGRGHANAGIATELYMSVATVKTHVSRILAKLDLNNRVQIALLARDAGLLDDTEER
ncbi:LuxR C-terminal-related transcriptional regulator, partial [Streptomyces hirsutus]|uniref:response regulator transcription factor n=1 Tax=Streptomyces hirsutus TaxID=35620 RepID=UPI0033E64D56